MKTQHMGKPLRATLVSWFLILALLPMLVGGGLAYWIARDSLITMVEIDLEQSSLLERQFIENWFNYRFRDLESQANNPQSIYLLSSLNSGMLASNKSLPEYIASKDWGRRVFAYDDSIRRQIDTYDYIADILLIDLSGNVIYSNQRELLLGKNLKQSPLSETRLAQNFDHSLRQVNHGFTGLEWMPFDQPILNAFLTSPVVGPEGEAIGVIAIEVKIDSLFEVLTFSDSTDSRFSRWVVGDDGLLRVPVESESDVLTIDFDVGALKYWDSSLNNNSALAVTQNALQIDDQLKIINYQNVRGETVFGKGQKLNIPGVNWWVVSEHLTEKALEPVKLLEKTIVLVLVLTGCLAIWAAVSRSRKITESLESLAQISQRASEPNFNEEVRVEGSTEIIHLGNSFNRLLQNKREYGENLEYEKRRLELVLESSAAGVWEWDFRTDEISITERWAENLGYSLDELSPFNFEKWSAMIHPDDIGSIDNAEDEHFAGRSEWYSVEGRMKHKDGRWVWIHDLGKIAQYDEKGNRISMIGASVDISERKNLEIAQLAAVKAAEDANQAKSNFLANMSHEIRTPMNGVIGMTNLLLDTELSLEQFDYAKRVKSSSESLLHLINDILDFSKIEAGRLEFESIDFDMEALLSELGATLAFRAEEKGLEIICPADPINNGWFTGDPGRIRQVLTNLIGNAIKFTDKGEIAVRYQALIRSDNKTTLRFAIVDSGIGLTSEQQINLFERFTQADDSTTRKFGGTGLGLAISKQLVEAMGGEIGVNSEPGQGAEFWFTLNLENVAEQKYIVPRDNLHGCRIVAVDDNETNRLLLERLLQSWGAEYQIYPSGAEALEGMRRSTISQSPFDIAILDMHMPEMDGEELGQRIKSDDLLKHTKMILLSSGTKRGDAEFFRQKGFTGYLAKPIDQSELYNVILQVGGPEPDSDRIITRYTANEVAHFTAHVLVVEDNRTNQLVAGGILKKLGVTIDIAANGEESLQMLASKKYDLVLMDCQMPVMDGFEASRVIRGENSPALNPAVPIIALTANAMQGDREKCIEAGMDDYLAKPVTAEKLRQTLSSWLL